MKCQRIPDAAVYVLGALTLSEREEYEAHLKTCTTCQATVAEFASLPSLLGRLSPEQAEKAIAPDAPEAAPSQQRERGRGRSHRRIWRTATAVLAAACLIVVAWMTMTGWLTDRSDVTEPTDTPTATIEMITMEPVAGQRYVGAELALTTHPWGTRIDMLCWYARQPSASDTDPPPRRAYHLVVVGQDGDQEVVSSWLVEPGGRAEISGTTERSLDEIARVEIHTQEGQPLLTYTLT